MPDAAICDIFIFPQITDHRLVKLIDGITFHKIIFEPERSGGISIIAVSCGECHFEIDFCRLVPVERKFTVRTDPDGVIRHAVR